MATRTSMTAEQFDQLPLEEGRRYELLDGEFETASANLEHNGIAAILIVDAGSHLHQHRLGRAFPETEFGLGAERLRPDIAILLAEKCKQAHMRQVPVAVVPDIAIEIVSPSDTAYNLDRKVRAYLRAGVAEVWVIYPELQHMYVHTKIGPRVLEPGDVLETPVIPGWSMLISKLFEPL